MYTKDKSNKLSNEKGDINYKISFNDISDGLSVQSGNNDVTNDGLSGTIEYDQTNNSNTIKEQVIISGGGSLINKSITITAETVGDFQKKLYAKFTFVENKALSTLEQNGIRVEDEVGRAYCTLIINNTEENTQKYTVPFVPENLLIDSTNSYVIGSQKNMNDKNFINQVVFSIDSGKNANIKFYKKNRQEKYTEENFKNIVIEPVKGGS